MNRAELKLIYPNERYLESFLQACIEEKTHERKTDLFPEPDDYPVWKNTIIQRSIEKRNGVNLTEGHVPGTDLWLIEGDEFIGGSNIRHWLTPNLERFGGHIGYAIRYSRRGMGYGTIMLALTLPFAAQLGIKSALITCNENNVASARVMEKNGGIYQDTIDNVIEGKPVRTKRYFVPTGLDF